MKKLSVNELEALLKEEESTHLDFKAEHHTNTANLIHDILCLSNADSNLDRFIIFGVTNNKTIAGISGRKRKQAEVTDCLRSSNINCLPTFLLYSIVLSNLEIDVLHIKNMPFKPYYLLKDKKVEDFIVRAGVIYTRDNDANTPINNTATGSQIEKMWREQFGIDKSPLQRVTTYLYDIPSWQSANEKEFFHSNFPEFRIIWKSEDLRNDYFEHWINKDYHSDFANMEICIYYHSTLLKKINAINIEYKAFFPIPQYYSPQDVYNNNGAYLKKDWLDLHICAIISEVKDLNYYDNKFIITENIKSPIDVFIHSLRTTFAIHSLKITIETD